MTEESSSSTSPELAEYEIIEDNVYFYDLYQEIVKCTECGRPKLRSFLTLCDDCRKNPHARAREKRDNFAFRYGMNLNDFIGRKFDFIVYDDPKPPSPQPGLLNKPQE